MFYDLMHLAKVRKSEKEKQVWWTKHEGSNKIKYICYQSKWGRVKLCLPPNKEINKKESLSLGLKKQQQLYGNTNEYSRKKIKIDNKATERLSQKNAISKTILKLNKVKFKAKRIKQNKDKFL